MGGQDRMRGRGEKEEQGDEEMVGEGRGINLTHFAF